MKLSISNIGWGVEQDGVAYDLIKKNSFMGLEIAPTRIFPETPYERLKEAEIWAHNLKKEYGFVIPSMQSIWFGRQEKLFGCEEERKVLIKYTKKAVDFAAIIGCKNLVFGCPQNRIHPENVDEQIEIEFFKEIGDYAERRGTVIGMEANPPIYNTNYINDTRSALELIEKVNSKGFLLNLDVGTMIQNDESVEQLKGKVQLINHVHISEPGLKPIERRGLHKELCALLNKEGYQKYVSIEVGKTDNLEILDHTMTYVKEIFGNGI